MPQTNCTIPKDSRSRGIVTFFLKKKPWIRPVSTAVNVNPGKNGPVEIPSYIDREALIKKLYTDKKVRNGMIRFVFQKGIGQMMQFEDGSYARAVSETEVRSIL